MPASYANESPAYQSGSDESVIKKKQTRLGNFSLASFFYFIFQIQFTSSASNLGICIDPKRPPLLWRTRPGVDPKGINNGGSNSKFKTNECKSS